MNKFGVQIEKINKIQSPLSISIDKTLLLTKEHISLLFISRNF